MFEVTRMMRSLLLMVCMFGMLNSPAQATPGDLQQEALSNQGSAMDSYTIWKNVQADIAADNFAGLSSMEDSFRKTRARTPSGRWQLAAFHEGLRNFLAEGLESDKGCQYRQAAFVQRWAMAEKDNPGPIITDAALRLEQAWCVRGLGYADSVAPDAWPAFQNSVDTAAALLKKHKATASIDPEFYAVLLDVLRAQGTDKITFRQVVDEATAREPNYHRTYFNAVWYYLPQWGGSYSEVNDFALYAVERSHSTEGNGLYARVFLSLDECGCHILHDAADWPKMKQAMRDIYDRYPARANAEKFAYTSCGMGDTEEGHHYYRVAHPDATDEVAFTAIFATCDRQAQSAQ